MPDQSDYLDLDGTYQVAYLILDSDIRFLSHKFLYINAQGAAKGTSSYVCIGDRIITNQRIIENRLRLMRMPTSPLV